MSLVVSCCPIMSAAPSRVHDTPRMRGPTASCVSFRKGVGDSGSTIQIVAAEFEFWLTTARRRPSGDQAGIPFENPPLIAGAGGSVSYWRRPAESTNESLVCDSPEVLGSR